MLSPNCVIFQSPHTELPEMSWLEMVSVYELRVLECRHPGRLSCGICLGFPKIKISVFSPAWGTYLRSQPYRG